MSWVLTVAGFAALIILHELGHFTVAKAVGMRVERFYLFFPPKLASIRRGETEYGIGAVPLGGFVKITGMNPEEELDPEVAPRAYYHQPVWKRVAVIAAGPAMNLLLAFVLLFALAFGIREPTALEVGAIEKQTPAAQALRPGDRIIAVDGVRVGHPSDATSRAEAISDEINSHACPGPQVDGCRSATPVRMVVERGGRRLALSVTPYYDASAGRHRLGFEMRGAAFAPVNPSVPEAASLAGRFMWRVTSETVGVVARIFEPEERKQVSSIVGVSAVTNEAVQSGSRQALTLLAVISLSLAIINLFPFLPLDGGHIFWSLVEKLRGRPVPFSVIERASVVGFVLVLMLFAVGLTNDIDRLTGGGFAGR